MELFGEKNKETYRDYVVKLFEKYSPDWETAVWSIVFSYKLNGTAYTAQEAIESAKLAIKKLPEDYEHYSNLKGLYTTTSALFDFCMSPSGSLDQYSTLLNEYRKEARDYMNELDFVFE